MAALQDKQQPIAVQLQGSSTQDLVLLYCEEKTLVGHPVLEQSHQLEEEERRETSSSSDHSSHDCSLRSSSPSGSFLDDNHHHHNQRHHLHHDVDLLELISKEEKETEGDLIITRTTANSRVLVARKEAIKWLKMSYANHGFSSLTFALAVNYFDRFTLKSSTSIGWYLKDEDDDDRSNHANIKPWIIQLIAIACLSLASKVEETQVPFLLDLQVDSKYVFEARTIRRMEVMVLSTLQWRMNPVTPLSYLDHLLKGLSLKTYSQVDLVRSRTECLIVSFLAEEMFLHYPPTVLAAASMLHAMDELQLWISSECRVQLLDALRIGKVAFFNSRQSIHATLSFTLELLFTILNV